MKKSHFVYVYSLVRIAESCKINSFVTGTILNEIHVMCK